MSPRWPKQEWLRPPPYLINTRRMRPSGNRQVAISFGNVLMKWGRSLLRTVTFPPLQVTTSRPVVSRSVSVRISGSSDNGVFIDFVVICSRPQSWQGAAQNLFHDLFGVKKRLGDLA